MLKRIIKNPIDVWHYLLGNYRYKLYYSGYCWLIRQHIYDQIKYRIRVMNKECYTSGSCIKCGCATTALQMSNKSCDGYCYPPMLSKEEWNKKVLIFVEVEKKIGFWIWNGQENKYFLTVEKPTGYVQYNSN